MKLTKEDRELFELPEDSPFKGLENDLVRLTKEAEERRRPRKFTKEDYELPVGSAIKATQDELERFTQASLDSLQALIVREKPMCMAQFRIVDANPQNFSETSLRKAADFADGYQRSHKPSLRNVMSHRARRLRQFADGRARRS